MAQKNDLVLIYFEDRPTVFARIENIEPDHKPGWFHVTLLLLQIPIQTATWILRDAYINGDEFTMSGRKMRLEKVESPASSKPTDDAPDPPPEDSKAKVVSFSDFKKNKP